MNIFESCRQYLPKGIGTACRCIKPIGAIFTIALAAGASAAPPAEAPTAAAQPKVIGPYSPVVVAGDLIFVSGQIALDSKTGTIDPAAPIEAQTRRVIANIAAILQSVGADLRDIVQAQVYLTDLSEFERMNAAYAEALGGARPARATVEVSELPRDAKVEIMVIAAKRKR